jgi:hypothetical protein
VNGVDFGLWQHLPVGHGYVLAVQLETEAVEVQLM